MAEFNSAPYFPIDLKGLAALFALAPDADIRARAGRAIVRLLEIVANSAHHGMLTAAQGRSYEHSLRAALRPELSSIARLLWGRGGFGATFHALPQLALCLRDHGLAVPDLARRARWEGATANRNGASARAPTASPRLYHWKTRAAAMGYGGGLPLGRVGLSGDPRPRPHRHGARGPDSDQPPRRGDPGRLRAALLLGRQRLDPAGAAVPRASRFVAFAGEPA